MFTARARRITTVPSNRWKRLAIGIFAISPVFSTGGCVCGYTIEDVAVVRGEDSQSWVPESIGAVQTAGLDGDGRLWEVTDGNLMEDGREVLGTGAQYSKLAFAGGQVRALLWGTDSQLTIIDGNGDAESVTEAPEYVGGADIAINEAGVAAVSAVMENDDGSETTWLATESEGNWQPLQFPEVPYDVGGALAAVNDQMVAFAVHTRSDVGDTDSVVLASELPATELSDILEMTIGNPVALVFGGADGLWLATEGGNDRDTVTKIGSCSVTVDAVHSCLALEPVDGGVSAIYMDDSNAVVRVGIDGSCALGKPVTTGVTLSYPPTWCASTSGASVFLHYLGNPARKPTGRAYEVHGCK